MNIEDMSEMGDLQLPDYKRTFLPDSTGHFSIKFQIDKANYFRLGRNILYLSPGDNLSMSINYRWPDSSIINGNHSQENQYLKYTPFPKAGSFLEGGINIKETIQQTIDAILVVAKKREASLRKYKNISNDFRILEAARIKADILNSLIDIKGYFPYIHKLTKDSLTSFTDEYNKIIEPYIDSYSKNNLNPSFLKLVVYRDVVQTIINNTKGHSENKRKIKDWINAYQLAESITEMNEKKQIYAVENKINAIQSPAYRNAVYTTFKELLKLGNGDTAKDFIFTSQNNESFDLKTFIGKVIYIDLWATWCGPCMEELPYLDTLKEKYKNNAEMVFIALSIDNNKLLWKTNLVNRKAQGIQGIIDRVKLMEYRVINIPRVIIIDKDFKIASMNGPVPSNNNTVSLLDSLLQ
ncbi:MAG: TlpA disulfide reductase family protein [Ginsengibacter sp.]